MIQKRLKQNLLEAKEKITKLSSDELQFKESSEKWSRKEILGHLIDSGINNLQRFTEAGLTEAPYKIRIYPQDALVKSNDYQNASLEELLQFWLSINTRIIKVLALQEESRLNHEIIIPDGEIKDLRFLIEDYVDHMEHHLKQIYG